MLITTVCFYHEIQILNQCKKTVFLLNCHDSSGLGKYKMPLKHRGWSSERYVFSHVLLMNIFVWFAVGNTSISFLS